MVTVIFASCVPHIATISNSSSVPDVSTVFSSAALDDILEENHESPTVLHVGVLAGQVTSGEGKALTFRAVPDNTNNVPLTVI